MTCSTKVRVLPLHCRVMMSALSDVPVYGGFSTAVKRCELILEGSSSSSSASPRCRVGLWARDPLTSAGLEVPGCG